MPKFAGQFDAANSADKPLQPLPTLQSLQHRQVSVIPARQELRFGKQPNMKASAGRPEHADVCDSIEPAMWGRLQPRPNSHLPPPQAPPYAKLASACLHSSLYPSAVWQVPGGEAAGGMVGSVCRCVDPMPILLLGCHEPHSAPRCWQRCLMRHSALLQTTRV